LAGASLHSVEFMLSQVPKIEVSGAPADDAEGVCAEPATPSIHLAGFGFQILVEGNLEIEELVAV
jgi:hypothetical protein